MSAVVQIMPMSDIVSALYEASVGPRGKPAKIVACDQQIRKWLNDMNTVARMTGSDSLTALHIMGVPVEWGKDEPPQLVWTQEVRPRVEIVAGDKLKRQAA